MAKVLVRAAGARHRERTGTGIDSHPRPGIRVAAAVSFEARRGRRSLQVHLLDMGGRRYGDCIVCVAAGRRILVDGGHRNDHLPRPGSPSIPEQLEAILGKAPHAFDLMVVTHCHADHIGCLPEMVADGVVTARCALVADSRLGFGLPDAGAADGDDVIAMVAAAIREDEPYPLADGDMTELMADVVNLQQRYASMLARLVADGTEVVRYGTDDHGPLVERFADIGLAVLGPSQDHLYLCADRIERVLEAATAAARATRATDSNLSRASLMRAVLAGLADGPDAAGRGAPVNNQSIVLKVADADGAVLLTGDMQLARPGMAELREYMHALRADIAAGGPYHFVKLPHHGSGNAADGDVLAQFSGCQDFGISTGAGHEGHPELSLLNVLQADHGLRWARTDRNGAIQVDITAGAVTWTLARGGLNDATPNGRTPPAPGPSAPSGRSATSAPPGRGAAARTPSPGQADPAPAGAPAAAEATNGMIEVTARVPATTGRVTITIDVERPRSAEPGRVSPAPATPPAAPAPAAFELAAGRDLPDLLFATDSAALARNVGRPVTELVLRTLRAHGHEVIDLRGDAAAAAAVGRASAGRAGVVLIGGYDVMPSQRCLTLPPEFDHLRGVRATDLDGFLVWNDEAYGDQDDDGLAEVPVSRIPDGRCPDLLVRALSAAGGSDGGAFGVRNHWRPFADGVYDRIRTDAGMLVSHPVTSETLDAAGLGSDRVYLMLHGLHDELDVFLGEDDQNEFVDAVLVERLPASCPGTIFAGCCYGALIARERACDLGPGEVPTSVAPTESLALAFLARGARAFVGSTGLHYSPPDPPYVGNGQPMHRAFWEHVASGKAPAQALFDARVDYFNGMPYNQDIASQPFEVKAMRQFTCLGLGW